MLRALLASPIETHTTPSRRVSAFGGLHRTGPGAVRASRGERPQLGSGRSLRATLRAMERIAHVGSVVAILGPRFIRHLYKAPKSREGAELLMELEEDRRLGESSVFGSASAR